MLPQPTGSVWLTASMKSEVSAWAEGIGYAMGLPVARDGVLLYVGQYQLLVADACSGLNSMFSLTALGALFLYLQREQSRIVRFIVMLCIWPIAFLANVMRVLTLILVTFYLGDEVGQGFMHQLAGLFLFSAALGLLYGVNKLLTLIWPRKQESS
jgi:exosortase